MTVTYDPEVEIPATYTVSDTPWLRAWEPLMGWMREHFVNPDDCTGFTIEHPESDGPWCAVFTIHHRLPGTGRHLASDCGGPVDEVCVRSVRLPVSSLPPYRAPSGRVLR